MAPLQTWSWRSPTGSGSGSRGDPGGRSRGHPRRWRHGRRGNHPTDRPLPGLPGAGAPGHARRPRENHSADFDRPELRRMAEHVYPLFADGKGVAETVPFRERSPDWIAAFQVSSRRRKVGRWNPSRPALHRNATSPTDRDSALRRTRYPSWRVGELQPGFHRHPNPTTLSAGVRQCDPRSVLARSHVQGTPATIEYGRTSRVTTDRAAMIAPCPISTPEKIMASSRSDITANLNVTLCGWHAILKCLRKAPLYAERVGGHPIRRVYAADNDLHVGRYGAELPNDDSALASVVHVH